MSSYATPTDLTTYGVNANALKGISTLQQQAALDTAATVLDGYLGSRFVLPLQSWGADIRRACAIIAAYDLMMGRGLDPNPALTESLQQRFDSVRQWMNQIARQEVVPVVVDSSVLAPSDPGGGGAFALQTVVTGQSFHPPGVNTTGAPPTIQENNGQGIVITGPASLRGW